MKLADIQNANVLNDAIPLSYLVGFGFSNDGRSFYYSSYEAPGGAAREVREHIIGNPLCADRSVFSLTAPGAAELSFRLYRNSNALVVYIRSADGRDCEVVALSLSDFGHPRLLYRSNTSFYFRPIHLGNDIYAVTNHNAPNGKLIRASVKKTGITPWDTVVPEECLSIRQALVSGDRAIINYVTDSGTVARVYGLDGQSIGELDHRTPGTLTLLPEAHQGPKNVLYTVTTFTDPADVYSFDVQHHESTLVLRRFPKHLPKPAQIRRASCKSKDGTPVPFWLISRDSPEATPQPALLTAYGGFGNSALPRYSILNAALLDLGFVCVVANVRGGSEFGAQWHASAKRERRQNAIDDFLSVAETLIRMKITDRFRLAIAGASNGGLLVGCAITQRPELFRAVVCVSPLLDMLKYHLFGAGHLWVGEFGSAEQPEDVPFLRHYSPYHNVKKGIGYPAVLMIAGGMDERVHPMHALKMVALLQDVSCSRFPVLLDYSDNRGHVAGLPLADRIDGVANRVGFLCDQLNVGPV